MEPVDHEFNLQLAFDSDDPEFTRGVEVGLLYAQAEFMEFSGADKFSRTISAANAEMALRVSEALDIPMRTEELGDDWLTVIFERKACDD